LDQSIKILLNDLVELALDDVVKDIFAEIVSQPGRPRDGLLDQIDVVTRVRGRIYARIQYREPTGNE
jgi:hypothetical protein